MKVKELIEKLKKLPQEKEILCRVVGQESGAWRMLYTFEVIPGSDSFLALYVSHPELKKLPKWPSDL